MSAPNTQVALAPAVSPDTGNTSGQNPSRGWSQSFANAKSHEGSEPSQVTANSRALSEGHAIGLQAEPPPAQTPTSDPHQMSEIFSQRARLGRIMQELAAIQTSLNNTGAPLTSATAQGAAIAAVNTTARLDRRL
ncbi:hypothetical protein [Pseudoruegeria sp. SK021]|uniref:hypothetical protein n=1 Tax=Pseudoruegeria sp. SK021 TaxID=1933035 RepID=UPI00197DDA6E|nr:hypothetical protein [Pseudoruegeria sp. SK021]